MKVFILFQSRYIQIGDGDLIAAPDVIHGVFETKEKAELSASTITKGHFKEHFGNVIHKECRIVPYNVQ